MLLPKTLSVFYWRPFFVVLPLSLYLISCGTETLASLRKPENIKIEQPNIIYILADDLGYGDLGAYGQAKINTPNIDRLAAKGMLFTQHYAGAPVCAPSRAVLLTGLHTGHVQVRGNHELGGYHDADERGQMPLRRGTETIAKLLQQLGYATGAIGKWGLGFHDNEGAPNAQGFDYFFGYLDQQQAHNYYPTHLWRNDRRVPLGNNWFRAHALLQEDPKDIRSYEAFKGPDYSADLMARDALDFIKRHRNNPFFLYFASPIPHVALQVPDNALDPYDGVFEEEPYLGDNKFLPHPRPRSAYAAMVSTLDNHVGQIVDLLERLGLSDNTLIVFSSDNGPLIDNRGGTDHRFFNSAGGLRGGKRDLYEGGVRVPMIASWPGKITPGSTSDHISAFWDIYPTFAEIAGISTKKETDGISLVPTLVAKGRQREHEYLYWEFHEGDKAGQAVRFGDWKAVKVGAGYKPNAQLELYNLSSDQNETRNVAAKFPDLVAKAERIMAERHPSDFQDWNFSSAN